MSDKLNATLETGDYFNPLGFVPRSEPLAEQIHAMSEEMKGTSLIILAGDSVCGTEGEGTCYWRGNGSEDVARLVAAAMDTDPEVAEIIIRALEIYYSKGE